MNGVCVIEAAPALWPDGWSFSLDAPVPPGWPKLLPLHRVRLRSGWSGGVLSIEVRDKKYDESSDVLDGHVLLIRAASGSDILRLKLSESGPWGESAVVRVSNGAVSRRVWFEWDRAGSGDAGVLVNTLFVIPPISTSVRVQRQ